MGVEWTGVGGGSELAAVGGAGMMEEGREGGSGSGSGGAEREESERRRRRVRGGEQEEESRGRAGQRQREAEAEEATGRKGGPIEADGVEDGKRG